MISNLQNSILKELDKQRLRGNVISLIMNSLDNEEKQNKFLSYMIENRNVIISLPNLFKEVKQITK